MSDQAINSVLGLITAASFQTVHSGTENEKEKVMVSVMDAMSRGSKKLFYSPKSLGFIITGEKNTEVTREQVEELKGKFMQANFLKVGDLLKDGKTTVKDAGVLLDEGSTSFMDKEGYEMSKDIMLS
jgi:hypothetical protein